MKRSFVIINFVAFLLTAAMASSLAFAQRPGGPPPDRLPIIDRVHSVRRLICFHQKCASAIDW